MTDQIIIRIAIVVLVGWFLCALHAIVNIKD